MAKLTTTKPWQHALVGLTVAGSSVAGFAGLFEPRPEQFDAKTVVVQPDGATGLRITEYVDEDFGRSSRHGYERIVPNDFGVPQDVVATSPDAPDQVAVRQGFGSECEVADASECTIIRIGDPSQTVSGQHRYELAYTLPAAHLDANQLALDVIGTHERLRTTRFDLIVTGFELQDPLCNVGETGAIGGCTLAAGEVGGRRVYRASFQPLQPGQGITIGGTVSGRPAPAALDAPALAPRRSSNNTPMGATMLGLGALVGGAVFVGARRVGRNVVAGSGAADAAYGGGPPRSEVVPPPPGSPLPPPTSTPIDEAPTRLVTDDELARMATVEFVPPTGVQPWQGAVVLGEKVDQGTVGAWFSGLAAREVITLENADRVTTMRRGRHIDAVSAQEAEILRTAFGDRDEVVLGSYDPAFAQAWGAVRSFQRQEVAGGGFWQRFSPRPAGVGSGMIGFVVVGVWLLFTVGSGAAAALGRVGGWLPALAFASILPAVAAFVMYRSLLPSRTARGSAVALRTESFRRFLAASEGKHVEWAWQHGLFREYSAWAVALGEARAWQHAMQASGIVPEAEYHRGPMVVWYAGPQIHSTTVRPAPSGGGGGGGGFGGFSGGSVGGGGGGGGSGSW